ncbi:hypothetical protein CCR75_006967 [Bremia lactucae]|uniref:Small secreted protein n=1 Tax=Bremia lactucae TaxID=4779 RepID=A0A976IDK3_BRELC|nr:hypothetical protein CCR75_006967 [Bremia lactucae]
MRTSVALTLVAAPMIALVFAKLEPCLSVTNMACPTKFNCEATTTNGPIQAAECSRNTRTKAQQTFAIFVVDDKYRTYHGAPYGTCAAYTCKAPTPAELVKNAKCSTIFWNSDGEEPGNFYGCIKDPQTGICGCEMSNGLFFPNKTDCK